MRVICVDASTATILLTEAPAPEVRDRQTGEIAKDAMTGETLMTVGVHRRGRVVTDPGHRPGKRRD